MARFVASLAFIVCLGLGSSGCIGAKEGWVAQTATSPNARVSPQEIYRRKDRLYVRVTFTNLTSETVTVDRDAMSLQLSNGRVLPRSLGSTSTHATYTLPPNGAHSIFVDFKDEAIEQEQSANVLWKGAVFAGTREVIVPPTPVTAR